MSPFDTTTAENSPTLTRRRVLVAGGAAGVAALAGCSGTIDLELDDVLISNDSDHGVSGSITIQDPADETVLDETFDLPVKATVENDDAASNESTDDGGATGNESTDDGGATGNGTTDSTPVIETYHEGHDNETNNSDSGNNSTTDDETAGGDTSDPTASYPDIFTESGDYSVAVELDDGSEIRGESGIEQTVTVSDTAEQSIVVGLDSDENDIAGEFADSGTQLDDPIWVAVSDGEIEFEFSANESNSSDS
jgi:hypothetical protein